MANPLVVPPQLGIPIILYLLTTALTTGPTLSQNIEREGVVYYLSKKFWNMKLTILLWQNLVGISLGI